MTVLRQLAGLFVEDGWLALAILGIVALAAVLALLMPRLPLAAGALLLFGCLGVLLVNVVRAARHGRAQ
jgi:small-conductance mechanosensitive channel